MKPRLLCIGLFAAIGFAADPRSCRCQPDQPCWPTEGQWAALNNSIGGNLVTVKPLARSCHDPNFNASACSVVQTNTYNSTYRSLHPGALQWENWETWPAADEKCYTESPRSDPCEQGRLSLFSAEVRNAQHIQTIVNFVTRHNIKLVIKNTGHDFLGRSSSPKSLQILTHFMKSMSISNEFVPTVPPMSTRPDGVKAVTVGAGVQLGEMYAFLGSKGLMAVGGTFNTVGVAGGYIQGGGHSFLGWLHGMASDNVLEFQVVLADGSLVFANAYQNSDLFFALRGGGGGSFGVVVSATVKVYPDYPLIYATLNYTMDPGTAFWDGVGAFQKHILRLNDHGGSGYYGMVPINPVSSTQNVSAFMSAIAFVNQTDLTTVKELFSPLLSDLKQVIGFEPSFGMVTYPSMSSMYSTVLAGSDTTGTGMRLGSQLVSRDFIKSDNSTRLTRAMSSLNYDPGEAVAGIILTGGQVSKNRNIASALNPAWRDTMVHVIFTRLVSADMTFEEQDAKTANITRREVPMFRSLEHGKMGVYVNEADADEVGFQQSFWGENYPRLRSIKASRDPNDLFIVRKGVGSEDWDNDGLCRLNRS
ncbi:hypothetical protein N7509_014028 [Penicillium cosmopolitanum]|uniref:FAD-binding PCMH-type domain-containing protein n=1 Tax=Penicillium cosmopolitanum TaxID=1131564 RepID=A0A9W9V7R5_9EURO|nr:uncharacterized protein N7509_014028 [Penicillium cosmopolitanum]KAJ5369416.1 hypothetical protein N7509_014028 [Penicillium cosmopolitanum]